MSVPAVVKRKSCHGKRTLPKSDGARYDIDALPQMKRPPAMMTMHECPLCQNVIARPFYKDKRRTWLRCPECWLISVPSEYHLTPEEEKSHYDLHQNSPADMAYRGFLNRLFEPVNQRLPPSSSGLDFGSGPGPTLSVMFEEAGHAMAIYDPFYACDASVLQTTYDFATASEVVEHIADPASELDCLWSCVKPGGVLGLMTKLALDAEAFATWHYKNDPTHISFYSRETFTWLAAKWTAKLEFFGSDVILLTKP